MPFFYIVKLTAAEIMTSITIKSDANILFMGLAEANLVRRKVFKP